MIYTMFKKWIFWLLLSSVFASAIGFYFWKIYECGYSSFCYTLFSKVGLPVFYGMAAIALVSFVLLFVPQAVSRWWKFAIWYVPFAAYAIAVAGPTPGQMFDIGMGVQETALWLSGAYIAICLVLIGISLRKKN